MNTMVAAALLSLFSLIGYARATEHDSAGTITTACAKPAPYGRGEGYPLSQEEKCDDEHAFGCEQYGAKWYPTCREGFHSVSANTCSPD